jgi:hypothetical protein
MALYAVGAIVALMLALLVGALRASPAQAETFTVNNLANPGSGGCNATECTLQEAVQAADANGQSDTINFAAGLKGEIPVSNSFGQGGFSIFDDVPGLDLTINGPGAGVVALNGSNQARLFGIASGANATIKGLTIKNGLTSSTDPNGGGIANVGTLTLEKVTVSGNSATGNAGGIYNSTSATLTIDNSTFSTNSACAGCGGGGTYNQGIMTVTNSTFSGNKAGEGAGIFNGGSSGANLTITNSTFSGNGATLGNFGRGGGIRNNGGTLTITNSTFSGNSATANSGGIYTNATATLRNTIVAGNTAPTGPDVFGTFNSQGNNLIGNTSDSSGWVASDLQNINPLLGPLQNNGGPTNTHALWPGSPAIDRGANISCPVLDQRAQQRKDGDGNGSVVCDIGAYERSDFSSPKVNSTTPAGGTGVSRGVALSATFSEKMTRSTLNKSTFKLYKVNSDGSTTQITNVTVSSSSDGLKATLTPSTLLLANTNYRAMVSTGARDLAGNQLDQSPTQGGKQQKVWNFKTGST